MEPIPYNHGQEENAGATSSLGKAGAASDHGQGGDLGSAVRSEEAAYEADEELRMSEEADEVIIPVASYEELLMAASEAHAMIMREYEMVRCITNHANICVCLYHM